MKILTVKLRDWKRAMVFETIEPLDDELFECKKPYHITHTFGHPLSANVGRIDIEIKEQS